MCNGRGSPVVASMERRKGQVHGLVMLLFVIAVLCICLCLCLSERVFCDGRKSQNIRLIATEGILMRDLVQSKLYLELSCGAR